MKTAARCAAVFFCKVRIKDGRVGGAAGVERSETRPPYSCTPQQKTLEAASYPLCARMNSVTTGQMFSRQRRPEKMP